LRSPLTALVAGLDYLEHRLGDLAKQDHELLELFEDNRLTLDSIEGLLSGMAAFTGAHSILGPVSTIGVVESAVQLTRWCTRRKGLAVSTHLAADVQARGTMSELVQIVVNLLTNATDEAPQRSTIHVCVVAAPEKAFIYVLDEGRGVPRALARAIFEPFHTSKANGMGLGLSIAREMAQRNGGDLYVCYDPPPELPRTAGACFALELARS
ncbi:MAG: HAMP domain-containing histidine kinase, partial [Sandaracinaceae bacterium]|nr:HAMP domain-containing histidine kinase [Sandaracinaceae bacterium]